MPIPDATLSGHMNTVVSATFSPNGDRVLTASVDSTARVWGAGSGKELQVLRGHENIVWSAQFSPDGKTVATASGDKTGRLWDARIGKPLGEAMKHEGEVGSGAYSPDGTQVVTASDDKTARFWGLQRSPQLDLLECSGEQRISQATAQFADRVFLLRKVICLNSHPSHTFPRLGLRLLGL
jgi:WD40 repeat protein